MPMTTDCAHTRTTCGYTLNTLATYTPPWPWLHPGPLEALVQVQRGTGWRQAAAHTLQRTVEVPAGHLLSPQHVFLQSSQASLLQQRQQGRMADSANPANSVVWVQIQ